ncbi:hypothetical protein GW17_00037916 [Ensete ventricosum]|nr:hypothetical protein GW17_00037916 [Ensete ventricosum]
MSDPASLLSSNAASLFTSPRLFVGFSPKSTADPEAGACQTSILETKPFSAIRNPFFFYECRQLPRENGEPTAIGLGLLEVLTAGDSVKITPKTEKRSSAETGRMCSDTLNSSPRVSTGCFPQSEMELSEDYTCVILHGPNPRTTHIYDNCIIESCCCDGFAASANEITSSNGQSGYDDASSDGFLSFCCGCKKKIVSGEDVYMYRERAFCSHECRYQEMFDEGKEKC